MGGKGRGGAGGWWVLAALQPQPAALRGEAYAPHTKASLSCAAVKGWTLCARVCACDGAGQASLPRLEEEAARLRAAVAAKALAPPASNNALERTMDTARLSVSRRTYAWVRGVRCPLAVQQAQSLGTTPPILRARPAPRSQRRCRHLLPQCEGVTCTVPCVVDSRAVCMQCSTLLSTLPPPLPSLPTNSPPQA